MFVARDVVCQRHPKQSCRMERPRLQRKARDKTFHSLQISSRGMVMLSNPTPQLFYISSIKFRSWLSACHNDHSLDAHYMVERCPTVCAPQVQHRATTKMDSFYNSDACKAFSATGRSEYCKQTRDSSVNNDDTVSRRKSLWQHHLYTTPLFSKMQNMSMCLE